MINSVFIYLSIGSVLLPITIGFYCNISKNQLTKYIFIYVVIAFISDIASFVLAKNHINNMFIFHIWGALQALLLTLFYRKILANFSHFITVVGIAYLLYYIINSSLIESIAKYNNVAMSVQAILMIMLSLLYFYKTYKEETSIFIDRIPEFWIVIGVLIYFSGALFSFLLATDILAQLSNRFYNSWILHNTANIIKNILFAIGLWKVRKLKA